MTTLTSPRGRGAVLGLTTLGLAGALAAATVLAPTAAAGTGATVLAAGGGIGPSPWWWLLLLLLLIPVWLWWQINREPGAVKENIVHPGRPDAGAGLPKVDLSGPPPARPGGEPPAEPAPSPATPATPTQSGGGRHEAPDTAAPDTTAPRPAVPQGAPSAPSAPATPSAPADHHTGDGVGSYVSKGERVPVPVGGHLPLADPRQAPDGYPIKGHAESGQYLAPQDTGYEQVVADVWFATVGTARAAGFAAPESD